MLKDIIRRNLVSVEPDSKVSEAAKIMERENVGSVLVLDNDKPRGIVTDRDIVTRCIAKNVDVDDCTVENIMTESLQTVNETDDLFDCIELMYGAKVRRIPVVDQKGRAVGLVSFDDVLAVLSKEFSELSSVANTASEQAKRWAA